MQLLLLFAPEFTLAAAAIFAVSPLLLNIDSYICKYSLIIIIITMLILFQTAAGYALFRADKPKKLQKVQNLQKYINDVDGLRSVLSLQDFYKFKSTADAFKCISKLMKGKIPKSLSKFLSKNVIEKEVQQTIAVADKRLGKALTEQLGLECKQNEQIDELMRVIRFNIAGLLNLENQEDYKMMTLGVAHGLSRYKLKFSAEKVDIMIIQAVSLLDDLDKEINNYTMRLKEWYGWHFPQLTKVVADNLIYTKVVKAVGMRHKAIETDLSGIIPEDIEKDVKDAAEISMGTEISQTDEKYIIALCDQILELTDYRANLSEYLKNRMQALAPNLTAVVGELVGARLICHAGSLVNLAKCPASTVQILGAEKALFKAIKTRHNTPKYGIIYQAQLVSNTQSKFKGKVSRALAAKCSLCVRCDALGQSQNAQIGQQSKEYLQKRITYLQSNEGLKQTRKPNLQKVQGTGREAYGQRTEVLKRRGDSGDDEGARKRFSK